MFYVSQPAARQVKVCLEGRRYEIFGGYARYALGRPSQVIRSCSRGVAARHAQDRPARCRVATFTPVIPTRRRFTGLHPQCSGNLDELGKELFENFGKKSPKHPGRRCSIAGFHSRERCRQFVPRNVNRSTATDRRTKSCIGTPRPISPASSTRMIG